MEEPSRHRVRESLIEKRQPRKSVPESESVERALQEWKEEVGGVASFSVLMGGSLKLCLDLR